MDKYLSRIQSCGCVVCVCEDEDQCQGCGAKSCGSHPVGEIPKPIYETPPKRLYGAKTKRRTYTVTDEVIKSLGDIGNGNRSKGLRIAVGYHGRLKECLWHAMQCWEYDGISEEHGAVATECSNLLTEIAEAGK